MRRERRDVRRDHERLDHVRDRRVEERLHRLGHHLDVRGARDHRAPHEAVMPLEVRARIVRRLAEDDGTVLLEVLVGLLLQRRRLFRIRRRAVLQHDQLAPRMLLRLQPVGEHEIRGIVGERLQVREVPLELLLVELGTLRDLAARLGVALLELVLDHLVEGRLIACLELGLTVRAGLAVPGEHVGSVEPDFPELPLVCVLEHALRHRPRLIESQGSGPNRTVSITISSKLSRTSAT